MNLLWAKNVRFEDLSYLFRDIFVSRQGCVRGERGGVRVTLGDKTVAKLSENALTRL